MAEFKKLTTGEVASKRFTPVRMREGYSMDEVDEFLEAVEKTIEGYDDEIYSVQQEITQLRNAPPPAPAPSVDTGEIERLQYELANSQSALSDSQQQLGALQETVQLMGNQLIEARLAAEQAVNTPANTGPMDIVGATTTISRMLESAAKSHDDLIAQGEAEALRIRDGAQEEVNALIQETEAQLHQKLVDADATRNEVFAGLEGKKRDLEDAVEKLRTIERTTRETLVRHYTANLQEIQSTPFVVDAEPAPVHAAGKRTFSDSPSFNG